MQPGIVINHLPLLGGMALSIAVHAAMLNIRGLHRPPVPRIETGRTVLQLTLAPSVASRTAAPVLETAPPVSEHSPPAPAPVPPADPAQPVAAAVPVEMPPPAVPAEPAESLPDDSASTADTVEQEASLLEDKGVLTEAEASSSIQPVYPRISRRRGEEGIVILSVEVLASGRTGNIGTVRSSGYPRLDKAAVDAARDTSFTPAQQGGRAVDSTTELSFTFRLTDD